MQLKTSINTLPKTHSTLGVFEMELENFESQIRETGTGKLTIDFSLSDLEVKSNQFDLGIIKYKTKKKHTKEIIDTKKKSKNSKNLF